MSTKCPEGQTYREAHKVKRYGKKNKKTGKRPSKIVNVKGKCVAKRGTAPKPANRKMRKYIAYIVPSGDTFAKHRKFPGRLVSPNLEDVARIMNTTSYSKTRAAKQIAKRYFKDHKKTKKVRFLQFQVRNKLMYEFTVTRTPLSKAEKKALGETVTWSINNTYKVTVGPRDKDGKLKPTKVKGHDEYGCTFREADKRSDRGWVWSRKEGKCVVECKSSERRGPDGKCHSPKKPDCAEGKYRKMNKETGKSRCVKKASPKKAKKKPCAEGKVRKMNKETGKSRCVKKKPKCKKGKVYRMNPKTNKMRCLSPKEGHMKFDSKGKASPKKRKASPKKRKASPKKRKASPKKRKASPKKRKAKKKAPAKTKFENLGKKERDQMLNLINLYDKGLIKGVADLGL